MTSDDVTSDDGGTTPLPDGRYDVFIVDAESDPADDARVVRVDVTVVSGEYKGEVLSLAAHGVAGSDIDLMGMPAVLSVRDGAPLLTLDD